MAARCREILKAILGFYVANIDKKLSSPWHL